MAYKNMNAILLKQAYQNAQLKGTHELSPRQGYYVIQSVDNKKLPNGKQVPIVNALWKSLTDPSFVKGVHFQVATPSFYNAESTGPKHLSVEELLGKLIIVKDVALANNSIIIKWEVIDEEPIIEQSKSLFSPNSPSYDDILKENRQYGINDNHQGDTIYDEPDDE
jgi:hypothetical protein